MSARTGMADLIARLRPMVADSWQRKQDTATGDASTEVFWLTHNPQASGGTVSQGGTVTGTANYTWDTVNGRVEFTTAPASSVAVAVEYQHAQFTDDDLEDVLDGQGFQINHLRLSYLPDYHAGGTPAYLRARIPYRDLEAAGSGTARWRLTDSLGNIFSTASYTPDYIAGEIAFDADTGGTSYYLTARSYDLNAAAANVWEQKAAGMADWFSFSDSQQKFERQQAFAQAQTMAQTYRARSGQNRQRGGIQVGAWRRTDINVRTE